MRGSSPVKCRLDVNINVNMCRECDCRVRLLARAMRLAGMAGGGLWLQCGGGGTAAWAVRGAIPPGPLRIQMTLAVFRVAGLSLAGHNEARRYSRVCPNCAAHV